MSLRIDRLIWLAEARAVARELWAQRRMAISVEDVRAVLPPPEGVDPRIMGKVFLKRDWEIVGWTLAKGHCNPRGVRLFVPRFK